MSTVDDVTSVRSIPMKWAAGGGIAVLALAGGSIALFSGGSTTTHVNDLPPPIVTQEPAQQPAHAPAHVADSHIRAGGDERVTSDVVPLNMSLPEATEPLALTGESDRIAQTVAMPSTPVHEVRINSMPSVLPAQPLGPSVPIMIPRDAELSKDASKIELTSIPGAPAAIAPGKSKPASAEKQSDKQTIKPAATVSKKLNINTATKADLELLPGIGPALAERILEYRKASGGFKAIEELDKVKGIGERTLAKLKPLVEVAAPVKSPEAPAKAKSPQGK